MKYWAYLLTRKIGQFKRIVEYCNNIKVDTSAAAFDRMHQNDVPSEINAVRLVWNYFVVCPEYTLYDGY